MEQVRPDSTLLPAAEMEAEHTHGGTHDRDARITRMLTASETAPDPEADQQKAPPSRGTVRAPANTHPDAYGLHHQEDGLGLGLHAPPGADVLVEPVMPRGAGLAVFYLKGATAPVIFDLTHHFRPEHAASFAPGSEVVPAIEVVAPVTGRPDLLRADRIEKIHRVAGIYTPIGIGDEHRRAPTPLPLLSECPEGMGEQYVGDAGAYPLVRRGETVVYDPSRREPTDGALCVLQWNNGVRSVLLTNRRRAGGTNPPAWWTDPANRPSSRAMTERLIAAGALSTLHVSDGPYKTDHLREKIVGTVVGVLVSSRNARAPHQDTLALLGPAAAPCEDDEPQAVEDNDDAELLRLGRLFTVACARDLAACSAANDAQEEAKRREPARPACLTYRPSDDDLSVYGWHTLPEALEGIEVGSEDIARLRRKMPMTHEVLRPIREGERAHMDHPGKRFDIVPHPEAQARAEEIVAAWDAWRAESKRTYAEHVTPQIEAEAEEAGEAAMDLADRIAALPAHTAAGLRVKLRALCHFDPASMLTTLPEYPDPDQRLYLSLRQDVEREAEADAIDPVTVESAAPLNFDGHDFEVALRSPQDWADEFAAHALGMHVADKTLRMSKPELVAFITGAADKGGGADEAMFKALTFAQEAFEGWGKLLEVAALRYLVGASTMTVEREARQAESGEA